MKSNNPLIIESYLRCLSHFHSNSFKVKYFKLNLINGTFGVKINKEDKVYRKLYLKNEILSFDENVSIDIRKKCKWKYSFKVRTICKLYVLFSESKEEYEKWIKGLKELLCNEDNNKIVLRLKREENTKMSAGKKKSTVFEKPKKVTVDNEVDIEDDDSVIKYKEELNKSMNVLNRNKIFKSKESNISDKSLFNLNEELHQLKISSNPNLIYYKKDIHNTSFYKIKSDSEHTPQNKKSQRESTWDDLNSEWKVIGEVNKDTAKISVKDKNTKEKYDNCKLHIKQKDYHIETLHFPDKNETHSIDTFIVKDKVTIPSTETLNHLPVSHSNEEDIDRLHLIQAKLSKQESESIVYLGKNCKQTSPQSDNNTSVYSLISPEIQFENDWSDPTSNNIITTLSDNNSIIVNYNSYDNI